MYVYMVEIGRVSKERRNEIIKMAESRYYIYIYLSASLNTIQRRGNENFFSTGEKFAR